MDRRTVLRSLAGGTGLALSGCTSRDASTTASPKRTSSTAVPETTAATPTRTTDAPSSAVAPRRHTVSVTRQTKQGQRGVARVLRMREGGRLERTLTCADGTSKTTTAELPADRWREFERLVLRADVGRFDSEYECSGDCPQDLPGTRLTLAVDGTTTVVRIEAAAEVPAALDAILSAVESFEDSLDAVACD